MIDNEDALKKFVEDLKRKLGPQKVYKCLCLDKSQIITSWDTLRKQHRQLVSKAAELYPEVSIANILIPSDQSEGISPFTVSKLEKMLRQFNAVGWATIFRWYWDLCQIEVNKFYPSDSEEYSLQAYFDDFRHQVFSIVLQQEQYDLLQALDKIEDEKDNNKIMEYEKQMVSSGEKILALLSIQKEQIKRILDGIKEVEEDHPELTPVKNAAEEILEAFDAKIAVVGSDNSDIREKFQNLGGLLAADVINL